MYGRGEVERLLRSYVDFREFQGGTAQKLFLTVPMVKIQRKNELPLGMNSGDPQPWPFMEPQHAAKVFDGKGKADKLELIWVSMLDLEEGLRKMPDDDVALLYKYYVFQTHTLDELKADLPTNHRSTVLRTLHRIVEELARKMDNEPRRM